MILASNPPEGILGMSVAIAALLFVAMPAVILHYVTQWKKTRGLSSEDEKMLTDLYASAQRLEQRIENLERVLEANERSKS
jgi:phage shock protein B